LAVTPTRSCLVCRRRAPKSCLLRLNVAPSGALRADPLARLPGRGAYLCGEAACLDKALRGGGAALARALRVPSGAVQMDTDEVRRQWESATAGKGEVA
jgi:predicted RNA-binding protein YlxR (DUF448 family)